MTLLRSSLSRNFLLEPYSAIVSRASLGFAIGLDRDATHTWLPRRTAGPAVQSAHIQEHRLLRVVCRSCLSMWFSRVSEANSAVRARLRMSEPAWVQAFEPAPSIASYLMVASKVVAIADRGNHEPQRALGLPNLQPCRLSNQQRTSP